MFYSLKKRKTKQKIRFIIFCLKRIINSSFVNRKKKVSMIDFMRNVKGKRILNYKDEMLMENKVGFQLIIYD
jgi:hypothetical protein